MEGVGGMQTGSKQWNNVRLPAWQTQSKRVTLRMDLLGRLVQVIYQDTGVVQDLVYLVRIPSSIFYRFIFMKPAHKKLNPPKAEK